MKEFEEQRELWEEANAFDKLTYWEVMDFVSNFDEANRIREENQEGRLETLMNYLNDMEAR